MGSPEEKNHVIDVNRIRELCQLKGISFAEFGRQVGLENREAISRRLQNKHKISGDELILMARELGVSVEDLATEPIGLAAA